MSLQLGKIYKCKVSTNQPKATEAFDKPFLLADGFFEMSHVCSCASDDTSVEPNPTYSKSQVLNDPRIITDESFDTVCCLLYISFHSIVANPKSILSETESLIPELRLLELAPLQDLCCIASRGLRK